MYLPSEPSMEIVEPVDLEDLPAEKASSEEQDKIDKASNSTIWSRLKKMHLGGTDLRALTHSPAVKHI